MSETTLAQGTTHFALDIISDLISISVDESILSRLSMGAPVGWQLSKGWEETYYDDEICWYLITDPDELRTDRPTVRLMAAEELISDLNFQFIDRALEALFQMLLDPYDEHR